MTAITLETLTTPSLVLERGRLQANLDRFSAAVSRRGVRLRPHLKTAKCIEVTRLAAPSLEAPVAVSTLLEAEYFFAQGYRDIFYTVGLGPGKFHRVANLLRSGARLITSIDALSTAEGLALAAARENVPFRTVIEIDCGEHRGGVLPGSDDLLRIAQALGPHFKGVATHGGQSYGARSASEVTAVGEAEVNAVIQAATRLSALGRASEIVSVGSSPTALSANSLAGVTELRAGVYMFGDLFQAGIGTCTLDDLALSVLTEVIGRPEGDRSRFLIDAGAFALSKDLSTAALPSAQQAGFGLVCDLDGKLLAGLKVERVWQEHGLVVSDRPLSSDAFPIGTRLRILPNHACPTAAAHGAYHVVQNGRTVLETWSRVNGW